MDARTVCLVGIIVLGLIGLAAMYVFYTIAKSMKD
jgi:hypothetical protein